MPKLYTGKKFGYFLGQILKHEKTPFFTVYCVYKHQTCYFGTKTAILTRRRRVFFWKILAFFAKIFEIFSQIWRIFLKSANFSAKFFPSNRDFFPCAFLDAGKMAGYFLIYRAVSLPQPGKKRCSLVDLPNANIAK